MQIKILHNSEAIWEPDYDREIFNRVGNVEMRQFQMCLDAVLEQELVFVHREGIPGPPIVVKRVVRCDSHVPQVQLKCLVGIRSDPQVWQHN